MRYSGLKPFRVGILELLTLVRHEPYASMGSSLLLPRKGFRAERLAVPALISWLPSACCLPLLPPQINSYAGHLPPLQAFQIRTMTM